MTGSSKTEAERKERRRPVKGVRRLLSEYLPELRTEHGFRARSHAEAFACFRR